MANMNSRNQFELNDDNNFETFNFRLENRASDPAGGMLGSAYYNTTSNVVRVKDTAGWVSYTSGMRDAISYLYNCKPLLFQSLNRGLGSLDIGPVPAGKRWMVVGIWYTNATGAAITYTSRFIKSSVITGAQTAVVIPAGSTGGIQSPQHPILEAGDFFRHLVQVAGGLNINMQVWEFDDISPMKSVYVSGLNLGDNTIYTCPVGKKAYPITNTLGSLSLGNLLTSFIYSNSTGGPRTVYGNLVKSGESPIAPGAGSNCLRHVADSVAHLNAYPLSGVACPAALEPGDYLSVNTNTTSPSQYAWLNLLEL